MKGFIAVLFALMLVASIMPAAMAQERINVRTGTSLETGDSNAELESNTDIESNSTSDNETELPENETEVPHNETEREGRNRTIFREEMQRVKGDFKEGSLQLRQEFKAGREAFLNMTPQERQELLKSLQERRKSLLEDRKAGLEQIREDIKQDQERLKELRGKYQEDKDSMMKAREDAKKCVSSNTTECKKAKQEFNAEAKDFMGNAAQQMLSIINTTKTRVEANTNIDNETSVSVIAQLDARASAIEAAQAKITALGNTTDLNATKTAAAELRAAWQQARVTIRLTDGLLQHARYAEFLDNLRQMETRFKEARTTLAAKGKDVTQLDADIASFSAKIDAAQTQYTQAQQSYIAAMSTVKTEAEANTLLKSTRDQLAAGRKELQDARQDLRAIIKDIRSIDPVVLGDVAKKVKADADASASVEDEVEA